MTRRRRVLLLLLLALPLLLAGSGGLLLRSWWTGSVPARSGTVALAGLHAAVTVAWDPRGVPTIEASTFEDALRAQGYVHGLVRPFQVELRRRATIGALAEFAGARALPLDVEALEHGYAERGADDERALDAEQRAAVAAYVGGLNAGLRMAARRLPPALRVARLEPRPWTAAQVLGFGRRFARGLTNAAAHEQTRFELLKRLGPDDAAALWSAAFGEAFPPVPEGTRALLAQAGPRAAASAPGPARELPDVREAPGVPGTAMPRAAMPRAAMPGAAMPGAEAPGVSGTAMPGAGVPGAPEPWLGRASNAWAVAGSRSATGAALLAGDPHLDVELPAVWYEVRLRWPGGALAGASLAGVPGVIIGHSDHLAWSFTTANVDDADVFLVEVDDPAAPARYRERDDWMPFAISETTRGVKDDADARVVVRRAGAARYIGPAGIPGYGLLERWAAREGQGPYPALHGIMRATNLDDAIVAARRFPGPGQNWIAAARDGSIAHAVVGLYPRRAGADWDGRNVAPWTGAGAWDGFVPDAQMPLSRDPARGFVYSANEPGLAARPAVPGQQALTGDFEAPWRARRLAERLAALARPTRDDMADLQRDARSGSARDLAELLHHCALDGPAAALYRGWDGTMTGTGAPLLHEVLRAQLQARMLTKTRLGAAQIAPLLQGTWATIGLLREAREHPWIEDWIDDPATAWSEGTCGVLRGALEDSWRSVRAAAGAAPEDWSWQRWHLLAPASPVGVGPLAEWFNPPAAGVGGAADSPSAMHSRLPPDGWSGMPFHVAHAPTYRLLAALDPAGVSSWSAMPGGQDEHPAAPHAWDRLEPFAKGRLDALVPAEAPAGEPLRLVPGSM